MKEQVNHKDFDKLNNSVANLEWTTRLENVRHAFRGNRYPADAARKFGEAHHKAKLTEPKVLEILKRLEAGESGVSLGKEFGVGHETVYGIRLGKSWTKLTGIKRSAVKLETM